jgi:phosphate:Na+ symporter
LKISKFALPLIAFGGVVFMVTKKEWWLQVATMCIGIGLLFIGLDYMKASVETFAKSFDFTQYHNLWAF